MADNRTKILFYLTYSDAYFANGDYNKAKQQAEELNLEKELDNI
ncbi:MULTISPECIES: hypothetical protein [unclassified Candidatus Tisiphia]